MTRSMISCLFVLTMASGCVSHHAETALPEAPAAPAMTYDERLLDAELRACESEPDPSACFDAIAAETSDREQQLVAMYAKSQWQLAESERQAAESTRPRGPAMMLPSEEDGGYTLDSRLFTSQPLADMNSGLKMSGFEREYGPGVVVWFERAGRTVPILHKMGATTWVERLETVLTADGRVLEASVAGATDSIYAVWGPGTSFEGDFVIGLDNPVTPQRDVREIARVHRSYDYRVSGGMRDYGINW